MHTLSSSPPLPRLLYALSLISLSSLFPSISFGEPTANEQSSRCQLTESLHQSLDHSQETRRAFEELKAEGYCFSQNDDAPPGSLTATLWAIGPGMLVHGAGHWQLGDRDGALRLLFLEGLGVSLLGTGLALQTWGGSNLTARSGAALSQLGVSTLLTSWLADVSGSSRGASGQINARSRLPVPRFLVGYLLLQDQSLPSQNHLQLGTQLSLPGGLIASPELLVDFEREDIFRVKLMMSRWWEGSDDLLLPERWAIHLGGQRFAWQKDHFTLLQALLAVEGAWPLRGLALGLSHLSVTQRIGVAVNAYQLSSTERAPRWIATPAFIRSSLITESRILFDSSRKSRFFVGFTRDSSALVRPVNTLSGFFELGAELLRVHAMLAATLKVGNAPKCEVLGICKMMALVDFHV